MPVEGKKLQTFCVDKGALCKPSSGQTFRYVYRYLWLIKLIYHRHKQKHVGLQQCRSNPDPAWQPSSTDVHKAVLQAGGRIHIHWPVVLLDWLEVSDGQWCSHDRINWHWDTTKNGANETKKDTKTKADQDQYWRQEQNWIKCDKIEILQEQGTLAWRMRRICCHMSRWTSLAHAEADFCYAKEPKYSFHKYNLCSQDFLAVF